MRVRYHSTERADNCITLLSLEPQFRTIFTYNQGGKVRLPWPHLFFLFRYNKVDKGFVYNGLSGNSLRVLVRGQPLTSFDDTVGFCPTEHHGYGVSCTDHGWDGTVFKHPTDMVATIMEIWWGSPHHMNYHQAASSDVDKWKKYSLEEAQAKNWAEATTMRQCFLLSGLHLQPDEKLVDEPTGPMTSQFKRGPKFYGRTVPDEY